MTSVSFGMFFTTKKYRFSRSSYYPQAIPFSFGEQPINAISDQWLHLQHEAFEKKDSRLSIAAHNRVSSRIGVPVETEEVAAEEMHGGYEFVVDKLTE
jgi:hypothetical protein